jgi:hypothetical protein
MSRAAHAIAIAIAIAIVTGGLLVLAPSTALAADAEEEAAAAYDRGASAYDRGDFTTAATELARADELSPNDVTLELALAASARTTDAVAAMKLAARADKRPNASTRLVAAADAVKKRFASSVGSINVVCTGDCSARIDDQPAPVNSAVVVAAGKHRVDIARGDVRQPPREIVVDGGKSVELIAAGDGPPSARVEIPSATSEPSRGLAPTWFWVGVGVTAALGGATAFSALDTAATHDEFAADRSNGDLSNEGKSGERRTIVLGIATGVLAVTTVVLGTLFVDWGGNRGKVAIAPGAMRIRF